MTLHDTEKATGVEVMHHTTSPKEATDTMGTTTARPVYKEDDSDGKVGWTTRGVLAAVSLCGLYTASQILLYFVGGTLSYIAVDTGHGSAIVWIPTSYLISLAAVAPFVGYLQDLFGRRFIGLFGISLLCLGSLLMGTAHSFRQAVASMTISGAGAAIGELTALAGISDIVPVKRRALSVAGITLGMVPFLPFTLYGQLLATRHTWRAAAWLCLTFDGLVLLALAFTYFPKLHRRAESYTKSAILRQLDYVGGVLSIAGVTLLLIALQAGGYTHSWRSAYVLVQLLLGITLILAFLVWEWKGAANPMIPGALFQGQRVVALVYAIAFVAGMTFYSFLDLFPLALEYIYHPGPVQTGIDSFGFALGVGIRVPLGDALLSFVRGQVRIVLLVSATMMTAFLGALAASNPSNAALTTVLGTFAGLGCEGILTPAATVALIVVPDAYLATAVAISLSVRGVGGAIGYTIYSNIMNHKLTSKLPAYVATYAVQAGLPATEAVRFVTTFLTAPAKAADLPHVTPAIIKAATLASEFAWADSLRYVWLSTIPFGLVAMTCCVFVPSIRKYETNRIAAQM